MTELRPWVWCLPFLGTRCILVFVDVLYETMCVEFSRLLLVTNRTFLGWLSWFNLITWVSNVRLSVCTSIHKKFHQFQSNLVCRQRSMTDTRRYAVWPDRRSRSMLRALQSWKSFHVQMLSFPPFTMGAGKWPLILNSGTISKFGWAGFLIFVLVFVLCDFELRQKRKLWRDDRQSHTGLNYLCFVICIPLLHVHYFSVL